MPQEAIGELFRDFPVQKTDMWGSRWLCPDITAIGVLKKKHAALFVEYDGCFRHSELQAQQQDERKTAALLHYAPPGSCVLRIGHWNRGGSMTNHSSQEVVDVWRAGHEPSLMKVLQQTIRALLRRFEHLLQEDVFERLRSFEIAQPKQDFLKATTFAREAVLTRHVETKRCKMQEFLESKLQFSTSRIEALACKFPAIWGVNIDSCLRPTVAWLEDVGLSQEEVANVIARFPQVLGLSIEPNLKPTAAWLEDVGLSRQQVAKVVAGFPQVLGCSIDDNLNPTVAWLEHVGLSRQQVAKVVAGFPQVLSCSIDDNLKPTVAWLEDVGLRRQQVAKVIAGFPQVLGCSIDDNLKPTVAWLEDVGLSRDEVAKVVACFPQVLGCSIENNLRHKLLLLQQFFCNQDIRFMIVCRPSMLGHKYARLALRLEVLQEHNCLSKLASVISLPDATFSQRFPP